MSGENVSFSLQNVKTAGSARQYIRFNQIFAEGDVPQGQSVSATIGTQTIALQMDVVSRYADGSVKSAVLTAVAPTIAAGTTLQGSLTPSSATAGTAIAANAALAQGYDLKVNMDIAGLGAVTVDAAQKLSAAVSGNNFDVIRQGPLATEISFDVAVTRALRLTFDVVTYADGSVSTKVWFRNDAAMGSSGGAIQFNSLSIVEDGTTRFSKTNLTQYQYQVWAQDVTGDSSATQTLNVKHDIDYLERTGAIWSYDLTASVGAAGAVPSSWTNVLGGNGLTQYMPTTGGRPDIGPTTDLNARWLITQDASAAALALAQDQAAGSIPWHYYDNTKGHYLAVTDYPQLWIDGRGEVRPSQIAGSESGWTTDRSHSPDLSYVAWLMTGDQYHLDMLNAQASWVIANTWNPSRQGAKGLVANGVEELRVQAWSLRTVQEAAYANPDGSYEKAYFTQIANNNWAFLRATTATLTVKQGEVHGYFEGNYGGEVIAPWQQDFFASTAALGALQGNEDARAVLKWEANFLSGRFLSPDLNPYNGFNYTLNVYDSAGNALTSWADVADGLRSWGNYQTGRSAFNDGYYAELAAMSNANIISVFAGGDDPTDHRVAADAMRAYGWIMGSDMPYLRADPQYQIVPRLADGGQIGVTKMRVVAPTAQNTTLTFTGDNVFAFDQGIGRTTLNGTAGADVIIDNSTNGGDRLAGNGGDDYLIGGTGANVFAPGAGNDYVLIRGGAARLEVSAASSGRLEIEGFRPGTDIIVLTGTISLASILASAVSDGFGGTRITISPQRTIRLNGIAPSGISGAMFDVSGTVPINVILGTTGANTLIGTPGSIAMQGGAGNDTYYVDDAGDTVIEKSGEGTDLVNSSVSFNLTGQYIERLTLTGSGNINGTGNSLANTLTGNAGNNVLNGKTGADTMTGGAGNDTYTVDNAGDVVVEKNGQGTDRVNSSVSFNLTGQYIERLTLTGSGNINGTGNSLANTLTGNAGNNVLNGKTGADTMAGGAGNDTYAVDNAGDRVIEKDGEGTDQVNSSVSFDLTGQFIERLTLTGSGNINGTGNSLANTITGNAGNNVLDGKTGADTMTGGAGNDTYTVDKAGDLVVEKNGGGTDQVNSSVGFNLTGQYIERLTLTGSSNINATGNSLANTLTGNSGNNVLDGKTGADTMTGGAGNDTYTVDNAGDLVVEKNGGGTDRVNSSVSFDLSGQYIERLTLTGSSNINGTGNSLDNTLVGNAGRNFLNGGTGSDVLTGGLGADVFVFRSALGLSNIDTITDFDVAADTIQLDNAVFTAIAGTGTLSLAQFAANASGTAQDASDRIIYETDTGKLFYDSNGNAAGGATQFATLSPGLALSNADFSVV
ncbi:hypothetical protein [Reyranella sp.]|uniref:beta strand repeat-containing protein n=1 Tax=Reyranella sp. TaxID=1929291 RepID=UPI003D127D09